MCWCLLQQEMQAGGQAAAAAAAAVAAAVAPVLAPVLAPGYCLSGIVSPVLHIICAGDEAMEEPALYSTVVSVGSVNGSRSRSDFSNHNHK